MTGADTLRDQNLAQRIQHGWAKRRGVVIEIKRWFQQLLMMIGAVPYMLLIGGIFASTDSFFGRVGFQICFALYYVMSAYLHFRIDKALQFKTAWWLSPRLYLTALLALPWLALMFFEMQLQPYSDYFHRSSLWVFHLLLGSVVLTWLLSEWLCRFLTRYDIKGGRIYRRVA
jgi:hypothetical protein